MIGFRLQNISHKFSNLNKDMNNTGKFQHIILNQWGPLVNIILNRPKSHNALSNEMVKELL